MIRQRCTENLKSQNGMRLNHFNFLKNLSASKTSRLMTCAILLGGMITVSETANAAKQNAANQTNETPELPVPLPASRYASLIKKSPFSVATPQVTPVAPTPGFASSLYISGMAEIGDKEFVSISTKGAAKSFMLSVGESSPDGISLVEVKSNDDLSKSKVTLKKDGKTAVIGFDEQVMKKDFKPVMPVPTPSPKETWQERRKRFRKLMEERFHHHRHNQRQDSGKNTQTYRHSGTIPSRP